MSVLNATHPVDPNSGTGGVTITGYNAYTSFRYPKGLRVSTVNGKAAGAVLTAKLLSTPRVTSTATGLAYSRAAKSYTGTVTVVKRSATAIAGPFQVLLLGLTQGATLSNATGSFAGTPYITVAGVTSLSPGASLTAPVRFSNPSMTAIHFSPTLYTGGFN